MQSQWAKVILIGILLLPFFLLPAFTSAEVNPPQTDSQILFDQAINLEKDKQFLKAQELLRHIVHQFPHASEIQSVIKELEALNLFIINHNLPSPNTIFYIIEPRETLHDIARRYQITVELIKRRNHLSNDIIQPGMRLSLWKGPFLIMIDKSDNVLTLVHNNRIIKRYPISTGKQSATTPTGSFKVVHKLMHPVWFHRGVIVPPGTPENFLGTRWLGFDKPKYGIHGTIEPERIGQSVSSGCVRMRNEDVEELYELIPYETEVLIND